MFAQIWNHSIEGISVYYIAAKNGFFQSLTVFQLHPKLKSTRIFGLLRWKQTIFKCRESVHIYNLFGFSHSWSFGVVLWEMATLGEWTVIVWFIVVMLNLR